MIFYAAFAPAGTRNIQNPVMELGKDGSIENI